MADKHTIGYPADDWTVEDALADAVEKLRARGDIGEGMQYVVFDGTTQAHRDNVTHDCDLGFDEDGLSQDEILAKRHANCIPTPEIAIVAYVAPADEVLQWPQDTSDSSRPASGPAIVRIG